ncbi:hypothetical protein LMB49_10845 [Limosilactobacillus reuteri]|uniref:hypothetical protein n=1 Tax=Limosilactobacillus reuteri TaxID=1598 RepID=UPI001E48B76F|nr:hypothetical protein [Limosilactobacillus reuteri]MCC4370543.1 hypothetical protein [Limosilactobacillus reuteri]MCC4371888.1 hypothetical protein [Limosilactobacillus reuteri]MCC4509402.1 hypothetical protein [Limosilactobacillus reuteri]
MTTLKELLECLKSVTELWDWITNKFKQDKTDDQDNSHLKVTVFLTLLVSVVIGGCLLCNSEIKKVSGTSNCEVEVSETKIDNQQKRTIKVHGNCDIVVKKGTTKVRCK